MKKAFKTGLRYNRHYQLHYVLNGEGHFHINGIEYTAQKGELCLWAPGQVHSIAASDKCHLEVIGVQFDFTRNFSHNLYIPVSYSKETFDESYINEIVEFTDFKEFPPYIKIRNAVLAEEILKSAVNFYNNNGSYCEEKASTRLKEFFILLAEEANGNILSKHNIKSRFDLLEYIKKHYFENISNTELAEQFGYHPVHLNRIIHEATGMSLHQYFIKLRIDEAIHLLQHSNLTVTQIAEKVGYTNPQYFTRIFKSKTGHFPSCLR